MTEDPRDGPPTAASSGIRARLQRLDGLPFLVLAADERAVVFRLGRYTGVRDPGWVWPWPFIDRAIRVPLRARHSEITCEAPAADGTTLEVMFTLDWRVVDAEAAIIAVNDYERALHAAAVAQCMEIVAAAEFAELDADPAAFEADLRSRLLAPAARWGLEVEAVQAITLDRV